MQKEIDLLLKRPRVVDPINGVDAVLDIGVADGKVVALDAAIAPREAKEVYDLNGYVAIPGIIDSHVHASAIIGGVHAHRMMAKAGVTTALEMAGPVESVWEIMATSGAGLNLACIHAVAPGFSVANNAPSAVELQQLFETLSSKGAIGFKVVGGHFPLTPASTLLCMYVAEKNRGYFAIHAGTTETGSNLKGFMEAVELAKGRRIHIAHINSYCRGLTDRAIHEAIAAADALEANPNLFSESYLSPINGTSGRIANDRPASNATALTLQRFDLPPTYNGMKLALEKGIAGVMVSLGGETVIQTGEEAVRRWKEAGSDMNVSFNVNPSESRFHLAVAKRQNGLFGVDALSTDGGGIPRNVLVENGLALVDFGALTLDEFVLKTSTNPAWMLGLHGKGTLGVEADADITVLDKECNKAVMSVADGKVIMFKGCVVGTRGTALVLPQGAEYVTALGLKAKLVNDQAFFLRPALPQLATRTVTATLTDTHQMATPEERPAPIQVQQVSRESIAPSSVSSNAVRKPQRSNPIKGDTMTVKPIQPTPSAFGNPLLIKSILETPVIYAPEQEIVYRDHLRLTYREFQRRVHKLANVLTSLGVKPGDTVAVMDWDSHRYLTCFFAVPMMGAVLHTVNVRLSPDQLAYTINHAEDDILLVNEEFLPLLEAVRDKLQTVKKIILLTDSPKTPQTPLSIDGEYEALTVQAADHYDFPDFDENTMATVFYTTGTTGLPKGVFFSHRQIVLHTYAILAATSSFNSQTNVNSGDVYMPMTPMFHVHAWGVPYAMTLLGAKQVYPGRYDPAVLLKLVVTEKVTFSHCVPTIMHMLVSNPAVKQLDLKGWKVIIGGSALPKGLCRAAMEMGINIYTAYGMSETCPLLTISLLKPHMLKWSIDEQVKVRCRTGLPAPNVQLQIWDPEGNPLPHDGKSTGEVVVRAPWLTQGYLKDPDQSEALWRGGWLHTGDIGFVDPDGYLQITDRLKDVIKTGGEWISSLALEDIISQNPAVSESAVIGVPDEKWGERPLALIVLKEGYASKVTTKEIQDHCMKYVTSGEIPKYGVPANIQFVDQISKTSVGKINKKALRSQFGG